MSYEYNPIGMGQGMVASGQRTAASVPAQSQVFPTGLSIQARPFTAKTPPHIVVGGRDYGPMRTGGVVVQSPAPATGTGRYMSRIPAGDVAALKIWLLRQYGASNKEYQYLAANPSLPSIELSVYNKFKDARKRAKFLRSDAISIKDVAQKMSRSMGLNVTQASKDAQQLLLEFMAWWQQCEKTSWAAWDPRVIGGSITNLVPKKAFNYWSSRRATQTLPAVISGISVVTGAAAPMATETVGGQRVAQAAEAEGVRRIAAVMTMTPLHIAPAQVASTPAATSAIVTGTTAVAPLMGRGTTGSVMGRSGATRSPAMRGMGQADAGLLGATATQTRAKIREEMKKRRAERRLARTRRRTERRPCKGLTGQMAVSCAMERARRRLLARQISGEAAGRLQAERATRANVITSALGHKSGIASQVRGIAVQQRTQGVVPCPVGNIKNEIFGLPSMVTIPGTASGLSDNMVKIRDARARAEAERRRRLTDISLQPMPTPPTFVPGSMSIKDWIEARIRELLANSENTVVATEDKEDQVAKLEDILDEIKEQLDEAIEAQAQGKATAEEVKALREQVDQLTAQLAQAQQELLDASQKSEEANLEQIKALQAEIENLKTMLASGQVVGADAVAAQAEVAALEQDVVATQEDILDAQAQTTETQLDIQSTEQAAVETSQEVGDTRPWMERNRGLLIVAGVGLVAVGFYYYRKNRAARQIPPPMTVESPSGL